MPDQKPRFDIETSGRSDTGAVKMRLWVALLGLALVPAMAGVLVTGVLLVASSDPDAAADPVPGGVVAGVLALVIFALVATVALLRYLLRPLEGIAESRSRLQVLYSQAREDSRRDGLTGLGNHRAFQEELNQLMAAYAASGDPFCLVLMDLDDLKVVNDHDGHAAGDELLASMGRMMRGISRPQDRLYRIGGDEFAMLMPGLSVDAALETIERMLHFSRRTTGAAPSGAFSAGISGVPHFTRDQDMLYRQADAALYWAKRHGRGCVEVFDSERDQLPDNIADATRNAVQEVVSGGLLVPVFQPIVDLRNGRILGFEGLIRPDPRGPLPDASRLFAAAEAVGRTVELDRACIDVVLAAARAIGPDRLLTINISPRTLEGKDFDAGWLLQGLYRAGISPGRVIVELTERDEIADLPRLRKTFQLLQQYGLRLAADDVGAGNAGLRLLSQVQFDIVKIDLSLVQDGVRRMGARAVLQSLRDLALSQRAHVVAEGVETREQLRVIRELEIGAGQGFLLGRPDASVAATFVDMGRLSIEVPRIIGERAGSELPAVELAVAGVLQARVTPSAASRAEGSPDERPAPRAIILPTPRLASVFEIERGAA
jgi:diguanylate cyclase (GGDEF)-like protein